MRLYRCIAILLLAAPFLLAGACAALAAENCSVQEEKLAKERAAILAREKELSGKVSKENSAFEQGELDRLIERHHASIEVFNLKLDDFNRTCKNEKSSSNSSKPAAIEPETKPAAEVAASQKLINTLNGYAVQAGAFKWKRNAVNSQKELAAAGISSLILTRQFLYFLWAGPYDDWDSAEQTRVILLNEFRIKGYVINIERRKEN